MRFDLPIIKKRCSAFLIAATTALSKMGLLHFLSKSLHLNCKSEQLAKNRGSQFPSWPTYHGQKNAVRNFPARQQHYQMNFPAFFVKKSIVFFAFRSDFQKKILVIPNYQQEATRNAVIFYAPPRFYNRKTPAVFVNKKKCSKKLAAAIIFLLDFLPSRR